MKLIDALYTANFFHAALIISRPECADLAYAEYLMPGRHKSHPPRLAARFKGESDWPPYCIRPHTNQIPKWRLYETRKNLNHYKLL